MNNVNTGIVGVGFVGGQAHTPSFKKIKGSNLVSLCDKDEKLVKSLADKWDVNYYLDYDEMLEKEDLDAVIISVPTPLHYIFTMKAIKSGLHVLCEMPMAAKIEQVKEIKETAEDAGVLVMPVLNFRFAPIYNQVKEIIDNGGLGKPIAVHFREFISAKDLAKQWPADSWAWDVEKSGGYPDFTLSVWSIDMIRWMFDAEFEEVAWMSNYPKLEEYSGILGYNTMAVFKLTSGLVGSLHFSASVNQKASTSRLEIYGDNTSVLHAEWVDKIKHFKKTGIEEVDLNPGGTRIWGHRQLDTHFINCIRGKEEPRVTVDDAIKAQEVAGKIVHPENILDAYVESITSTTKTSLPLT